MTEIQSDHSFTHRQWIMPCLIMLIALGLYLPTLGYEFVNWDDPWYVIHNPIIKSWNAENLHGVATQSVARNYAPITQLSLLIDHTFWGLNATGYHLTNIIFHALNVGLVFVLMRRLSRSYFVAWTTALLFATHPVQIETVAWVSSRKSVLSATFMLASLIYWLNPERTKRDERIATAWLFVALLTKAIAVVVPAIVLAYDIIVRKRSFVDSLLKQFVPGLAAVWLLLMTMSAQTTIVGGTREHFHLHKLEILALDALIMWKYVGMLFIPKDLNVMYHVPTSGLAIPITLSIIGWAVAWYFAIHQRNRRPQLLFAMSVFFLLFIPVLNLFPLTTLMNDRYLYLPSIAAFGLFARMLLAVGRWASEVAESWYEARLKSKQAASDRGYWIGRALQGAFAGTAVSACVLSTSAHLPVWQNDYSLWSYASEQTPRLTVVQFQWATCLHNHGQTEEAIQVLNRALNNCTPDDIDRKRIHEAISEWQDALAQKVASSRSSDS